MLSQVVLRLLYKHAPLQWGFACCLDLRKVDQQALDSFVTGMVLVSEAEIALHMLSLQRDCCLVAGHRWMLALIPMSWVLQVAQQQKNEPADAEEKQLAPVWDNSVGWGSFVAVSTNIRYQAVGAFEERVLVRLPHINCPAPCHMCWP